jgi:hypothetical protein
MISVAADAASRASESEWWERTFAAFLTEADWKGRRVDGESARPREKVLRTTMKIKEVQPCRKNGIWVL